MAIRAQVPVVPATIWGTRDIMKKGDPAIRPGTAHFLVHPPVPTDGLLPEARKELADRVQKIIASGLPDSRINSKDA